jgi:purine nucleosidase/pyrimidine-specific ribonucleoside hydrolase
MKKILIDCDPGIDDALALMVAAHSRELQLLAITTVSGNLTADRCNANARKILELIDRPDIPVACGAMKPLRRPFPSDPFSHGSDGLGELGLPEPRLLSNPTFAPDLIVELASAHSGELTIVATAPLTNIALALIKDPELPKKVSQLIIIGGAYGFHSVSSTRATGDNPVSEWNVYVDPDATQAVFAANFNLLAIGLDVAARDELRLAAHHYDQIRVRKTQAGWFLLGILEFVAARGFRAYSALIDSLAIAAAVDPSIFTIQRVHVAVETVSPLTLGQTVVDRREHFQWSHLPVIEAATNLDADRAVSLIVNALSGT